MPQTKEQHAEYMREYRRKHKAKKQFIKEIKQIKEGKEQVFNPFPQQLTEAEKEYGRALAHKIQLRRYAKQVYHCKFLEYQLKLAHQQGNTVMEMLLKDQIEEDCSNISSSIHGLSLYHPERNE